MRFISYDVRMIVRQPSLQKGETILTNRYPMMFNSKLT